MLKYLYSSSSFTFVKSGSFPVSRLLKKFFLKFTPLLMLLLLSAVAAKAQYNTSSMNYDGTGHSTIGLTFSAGVDVPLKNLNDIYRAAPDFDAGVTKQFGSFTLGVNLGYREFQPKYAAYVLDPDVPEAGTISYSNYSIFSVYTSAQYNAKISKTAVFYGGINLGSYYTHFSYSAQSGTAADNEAFTSEFAYFAPKIGVSFMVSEDLKLGIESRYNLFGSASYNYNTVDGGSGNSILYTTWTTGLTLNYRFP